MDWEATTIFYAGLHLVDDYFEDSNIKVRKNHKKRKIMVEKYLSDVEADYELLFTPSIRARYEDIQISNNDVDVALLAFSRLKSKIQALR